MSRTNVQQNENAKPKQKRKRRKTEIYIVTYFMVFLMLGVMGNLVRYQMTERETTINNSYNTRQELLAQQNIRGKILSAQGEVLAQTVVEEDGTEKREYPYKELFAHVIGYSTKGKTGVEKQGNMNLLTSNAFIGEKIQNELDSSKNYGDNIVTTLNVKIQ